ncbi:MAG: cupredoxin domain-containing protein [Nanoarchaeota archaeon]
MKNSIYLIGIIVLAVAFGFIMVKGNSVSEEVYTAPVIDGVQEVVLSLKDYNYSPNTVKVQAGIPVRIYLDSSVVGCLRDFTINDFGIRKHLKTPEDYVEFTPTIIGRYTFACSMGMGTGVLIVE